MQTSTNRVAMIVDNVSPTPFALLRRANHFQYRDEDQALKEWSDYDDPIQALTEECRRVLRAISAANQSQAVSSSKHSTSLRDASWSRFEDIGFASALEEDDLEEDSALGGRRPPQGLRNKPVSGNGDLGRPTTPSWADFLSSGFVDERGTPNHLLPPDKVLPPINTGARQRSSQSHRPRLETDHQLEPGELASIVRFDLDDSFWWVWMSSLAPEETPERKAAFGRCAVIETVIRTGRWLVMEEMVKGAAPDPAAGAYIAEKKGFFSWTRRTKSGLGRRKSTAGKHSLDRGDGHLKPSTTMGFSKTSIGPDQQAKIQAAALQLQRQEQEKVQQQTQERRGRKDTDWLTEKTNSVLTLQPSILTEASPAVKWAHKYDKEAIREAYLSNTNAGRGGATNPAVHTNVHAAATTDEPEPRPELPQQMPSSPIRPGLVPVPSTSSVPRPDETPAPRTPKREEKELETPKDLHPAQRVSGTGRDSPLPPPPKESVELMREQMVSPGPDLSPESSKQIKLHKDVAKTSGGNSLRKLFSRSKHRQSKLPDNASEQLRAFVAAEESSLAPGARSPPAVPQRAAQREASRPPPPQEERVVPQQPQPVVAPTPVPAEPVSASPVPTRRPVAAPQATPKPVPASEPSIDEDMGVGSSFNQGPLLDQPAFAPEEDDADNAVPPPIARHSPPSQSPPSPVAPQHDEEAATPPASVARAVDPQDRWAQIRKNAAERAAQRQTNQPATSVPAGLTKSSDADDDTSGEESKPGQSSTLKGSVH